MNAHHFSLAEFVSCGRGGVHSRLTDNLENHLRENCPACHEDRDFVHYLESVARRDSRATPPAVLPERARALFGPPVERLPGLVAAATARLVFDTFLQPLPAGLRGTSRLNRHLVFREHDLLVDVQVEPEHEAGQQCITGQVQSTRVPTEELADLPVMLLEGSRILMSTRTNRHGEFIFHAATRAEMGLRVFCRGRRVEIPNLPFIALEPPENSSGWSSI